MIVSQSDRCGCRTVQYLDDDGQLGPPEDEACPACEAYEDAVKAEALTERDQREHDGAQAVYLLRCLGVSPETIARAEREIADALTYL